MIKKFAFIHGILFSFLLASQCQASGDTGDLVITKLYLRNTGVKVFFSGAAINPDTCGTGSVLVLPASHEAYATIFPALLAAKSSGQTVSAYINQCFNWGGTTFPIIEGLYVK